jgi:hypothetical protein
LPPNFDQSCPKYGLSSEYNDHVCVNSIPVREYNDPLRSNSIPLWEYNDPLSARSIPPCAYNGSSCVRNGSLRVDNGAVAPDVGSAPAENYLPDASPFASFLATDETRLLH